MKWSVAYRIGDGRQDELEIEAPDRAGLFEELSRRGISAIRVEESTGRSRHRRGRSRRPVGAAVWGILAAVGVAGAVALFFVFSDSGADSGGDGEKGRGRIAGAAHAQTAQRGARTMADAPAGVSDASRGNPGDAAHLEQTSQDAAIAEDGSTLEGDDDEQPPKRRRPIFNSGTDELIALATCAPEGGSIPPLPMISRADTDRFIESLSEPIEIEEGDSEEIIALKERVHRVRQELVQVFKDNPDSELSDILNEHRELFNHNSKLYAEAKQEYDAILAEGDLEGAREYREGLNEAFSQMGVKQIENEEDTDEEDLPEEY